MNQQVVLDWFDQNKRELPWRATTPWGVMVSEFMLQQTPVKRVLPVWNEWMGRWPTPSDLAKASRADVITAWGRLGYPRRALRLQESAAIIARDYNNQIPNTLDAFRALPGVGEYTAAAICAFAFNQSTLVLDVNITGHKYKWSQEQEIRSPIQSSEQPAISTIPNLLKYAIFNCDCFDIG